LFSLPFFGKWEIGEYALHLNLKAWHLGGIFVKPLMCGYLLD
jgi:hypothetical protein